MSRNHLLYKFLWTCKDKVTRASAINNYEEGGIKVIDIESLIKSFRLSWLKRVYGDNSGAWKNYLKYILKDSGGLMIFNCNYNVNDPRITSQFYLELLKRLSEFREGNAINGNWHYIIWNSRDIRIDNKPFFIRNIMTLVSGM